MSIEVRNVSKNFNAFKALNSINLDIQSGELVALLGPSGCGKTTLLRIIAGLETPDDGNIVFHGEDVSGHDVRDRNVGFVFQHYALFRHMTVFDNVAFGLRMKPKNQRPTESQIASKVHELLNMVQLDWLSDRYPEQLSGGQRQRIALARALAVEPKVLLLDEPFGALDAKVRKELRRWLARLHEDINLTSVFVTHDQEEAMTMAERIAIMHLGWIAQIGSPIDIYETPTSRLVCEFIGNVNIFETQVVDDAEGHAVLKCPDLDRDIYVGYGIATAVEDKSVTYAIRPEKLLVTSEMPTCEHNWSSGKVHDIAYLGGHSVFYVELPSGKLVQSFVANAERRGQRPTWGDQVYVWWEDDSGVVLRS